MLGPRVAYLMVCARSEHKEREHGVHAWPTCARPVGVSSSSASAFFSCSASRSIIMEEGEEARRGDQLGPGPELIEGHGKLGLRPKLSVFIILGAKLSSDACSAGCTSSVLSNARLAACARQDEKLGLLSSAFTSSAC
ncbi:hypothetical protein Dimus_001426 [Dionaea muscipula]